MDILRRSLAPIPDEAWKEIDLQAERILKGNLSARKLVDFSGPHGWSCAAVNLGSLKVPGGEPVKGVTWGLREAQALVELRAPFSLKLWDLDNVARGAKAPELTPLIAAARKVALLEERAVYHGLAEAGIKGLLEGSPHKPIALGSDPADLIESVENAILAIEKSGIAGPYALVLGTEPYRRMMVGEPETYPVRKQVAALASGGVHWSPALDGGAVLSKRGGDFKLTVGVDLAIGYKGHDKESVELYFTESFTFRILEPAAAVELKAKG
jgi:uncharacterized linocin/CFP29 family protein